jgi:hypothetical protein
MGDTSSYKYYVIGTSMPVRLTFNASGLKIGAEAPDVDSGQLKIRMDLLSRIETSPDVEEIDPSAFETLCQGIYKRSGARRAALIVR